MPALNLGGLRSRLFVLILLAILPGFALMLLSRIRGRELSEARYREQAFRMAQQGVVKQDALVEATRELLQTLATQPQTKTKQCAAVFGEVLERSPQYLLFATLSAQGDLICSSPGSTQSVNVRDRAWFQKTMRDRAFVVGEYQVGRITGQPGISFSYPLVDQPDRIDGAIVATLNLAWLNNLIAIKELPPGSTVSVIDRNGVVLANYPDPDQWVGKSIRATPLFAELQRQKNKSSTIEAQGLDGSLRLFAFSNLLPTEIPDLRLIVSIPQSAILAQVNQDTLYNSLWLAAVTLLALIATWYFSEAAIRQPIRQLLNVTQKLTKGDLTARVGEPFQPGILGELAQAFNRMATSLEFHVAERAEAERAREVATIKERFVSMVSHEFRNPLSSVLVAAKLLKQYGDRMSPTQKNEQFDRLLSAVYQMKHLMEDVLLLGQDQAGIELFSPTLINPSEFCGNLLETMQVMATSRHRLVFVNEGDCDEANLDEKLLRSILTNLLSNAIKYSPNGGEVRLTLTCQTDTLTLAVKDEGIGIPAQDLPRLFESFHRGQNVGNIQGTGLGLAIVQRCVELHQGSISVNSENNAGTTFTVTLPNQ